MLKFQINETLTGDIDGVNKVFVSANYIALIDSIVVDGNQLTDGDYTYDRYTLTLNTAPVTSIVFNHFYREELDIVGEGTVEFGDITREVYEELGRNNISRVYEKGRVERMIDKSLKRITNKVAEKGRVQHYALEGINGMTIQSLSTDGLSGDNIQGVDIDGAMLAGDNVYIPYTDFDGTNFTTQLGIDSILNVGNKVLVAHRIPYGVQKPTGVYVDGEELQPVDNQNFTINTKGAFTIIKGKDSNQYLFVPYSTKAYTMVVKYVPDRERLVNESDVVDIPYEYTTLIAYEVVYRLLASREDERSQFYKTEVYGDSQIPGLLKEYRAYVKEVIKKTRGRIRNAPAVPGGIVTREFPVKDRSFTP